jgi:hypothetical protein
VAVPVFPTPSVATTVHDVTPGTLERLRSHVPDVAPSGPTSACVDELPPTRRLTTTEDTRKSSLALTWIANVEDALEQLTESTETDGAAPGTFVLTTTLVELC